MPLPFEQWHKLIVSEEIIVGWLVEAPSVNCSDSLVPTADTKLSWACPHDGTMLLVSFVNGMELLVAISFIEYPNHCVGA